MPEFVEILTVLSVVVSVPCAGVALYHAYQLEKQRQAGRHRSCEKGKRS
ncbi:hypothetical protein LWE61_14940 [Sphingobium sufflavum]|nr:hypothetical protein [Sphingobium sufflavum]MCE7797846.1 hypothetical protein [Sphingobium sufflavum]